MKLSRLEILKEEVAKAATAAGRDISQITVAPQILCCVADNPEELESDLLQIVRDSSDYVDEKTRFGVKYIVSGQLQTPIGGLANVRTVWITETDAPQPRLVTACPDEKTENEI